MKNSKRLLIAVDGSEASHKAVAYVADMIDGHPGCRVCLLHGIPPVPPFEHGGSEDPSIEHLLDAQLQEKRAQWARREQQAAEPMLEKAKAALRHAQVAEDAIITRFTFATSVDAFVSEILAIARAENCDTIVVGRETFAGLDRIFRHHIADDVIRRGQGHTIWVVE